MAQARKIKLNYRCPQCFMRDIDMDMFYDPDKKEYYCLRCSFHGDEKRVLEKNEEVRLKYLDMSRRFKMEDFEKFDD
ncbi:MAG: hypothetical protein Q4E33_03670 [Erysipelotrichaceae bacterium]|nr:hypothetical protein [Erysipelotrichaceae bacterium]